MRKSLFKDSLRRLLEWKSDRDSSRHSFSDGGSALERGGPPPLCTRLSNPVSKAQIRWVQDKIPPPTCLVAVDLYGAVGAHCHKSARGLDALHDAARVMPVAGMRDSVLERGGPPPLFIRLPNPVSEAQIRLPFYLPHRHFPNHGMATLDGPFHVMNILITL